MSKSNSRPIQYYVDNTNYNSFSSVTVQNSNYLAFIYYTGNKDVNYSGLQVSWGSNSNDDTSTLSKALTIAALCLVSLFCMGCCGVLCRRVYKSSRNSNRVYDQVITNYQRRSQIYEFLPENSIISERDVQRFFPRQLFKENLLEVSEKVCCVCFEE